jgi:alpha-glucosidase (family GH31 glycosyl hydrolase)
MRALRFGGGAGVAAVLVLAASLACAAPSGGTTVIAAGNARFEFLTPSLVRLEFAPAGVFVDAPTAVVERREWPPVTVQSREQDGWLIATSTVLTVRYRLGSGAFTAGNLAVAWNDRAGVTHVWHPGDVDPRNLGGLTYSLDNIAAANLPRDGMDLANPVADSIPGIDLVLPEAKPGLLSRSGYAFIDDSETPLWNAQRRWIEPRHAKGQDWYLFTYGGDYPRVLKEYAQLCGPIPMIPRYVLGPQITDFNFEYFPASAESRRADFRRYDQRYLLGEVDRMRAAHIPFDTLVLDFAWHNYGWDGGYDWSPLFPQPLELMHALHARGVRLSLNDHPGYIHTDESILSFDDSHTPEVLAALGRPPLAKPQFDLDLSQGWSFSTDPRDGHWRAIRIGVPWQEQGLAQYRGVGWYRKLVTLPAQLPAKLYLYVGEVRKTYRLFVNGKEATVSPLHWPQRVTTSEITPYLVAGQSNELLLRVEPDAEAKPAYRRDGILMGPVALRDVPRPGRIYFDLSDRSQAEVSMRYLHGPLMQQGVDFWWVDGGSGAVDMPGLNKQLWTNKVFYDFSAENTGHRAFILGRYGDWGSERYPGFFTGDAYSEWPVLSYEVAFSARGGNVLVPWISHDIGGFHGVKIDFDLYARWIEFGAFSGILRMHSAHENPREGNVRMPWTYGPQGIALMKKYFTLRTQLIPYIYTYAWRAHRESLPLLSPLYLEYPEVEEAYRHPHEYFFGRELLVAPVLNADGQVTLWLPPGEWLDFFSGKHFEGGQNLTAHYAVDATPVFVRAGAIVPEQPPSEYSDAKPSERLVLNVYGSGNGRFTLYEDDGSSLESDAAAGHSETLMTHEVSADGVHHLTIAATRGGYTGQPPKRSYELRVHGAGKPTTLTVDGKSAGAWSLDAQGTAIAQLAAHPIGGETRIEWR